MQAVAVILALAVLAGCDARAMRPTTDTWEASINNFFEKMVAISQQTTEMVQSIQTSEFRTELDKAINDSMAELAIYKESIEAKIRPLTETSSTQVAQDIQLLIQKLGSDLQEGKDHSLVYLNDMKAMMSQNPGTNRDMQAYLRKLRKRVNADTEEIRNTVATYMGELQSRASQNLDAAREQVEPYLRNTMGATSEKMQQVSTALSAQAEGLGQQLDSQAELLKAQLEATGQELSTFFEGMIQRLGQGLDELPSIASQVREKLEDIVDKVKETASA